MNNNKNYAMMKGQLAIFLIIMATLLDCPVAISQEGSSSPNQFTPLHRRRDRQPFRPETLPFLQEEGEEKAKTPSVGSPGITIQNPSAYGAAWGNVGIGIGLQERVRFSDLADGVFGIGFGAGNPQKNVALQIGISLVDISDIFADGSISWKLHRQLPYDLNIALGQNGFATWGGPDGGSSLYGVVTKRFILKSDPGEFLSQVYLSLGVGGGQFRSESNIQNGQDSLGVFTSVAVRLAEPVSAIVEWTGQDMTLGFSYVPFRNLPLTLVPAITDITGSAGDGTRFIFGIGYGFSF